MCQTYKSYLILAKSITSDAVDKLHNYVSGFISEGAGMLIDCGLHKVKLRHLHYNNHETLQVLYDGDLTCQNV